MKLFVGVKRAVMICAAGLGLVALVTLPGLTQGPAKADERQGPSPIKHVVVIYGENVSFDHYFGTYPDATNADGQPFHAAPGTPSVNGLTPALLTNNPNNPPSDHNNPRRLDPTNINDVLTCDQNHDYTPEQYAFDNGKMDRFTAAGGTATSTGTSPTGQACKASDVMNYYDGNTVTAMWNYAQHFALNDNSFGTTFGPSAPVPSTWSPATPAGRHRPCGAGRAHSQDGDTVADGTRRLEPHRRRPALLGRLLQPRRRGPDRHQRRRPAQRPGLSWGWFEGGFTPNSAYTGSPDTASTYNQLDEPGRAACTTTHNVGRGPRRDRHDGSQGLGDQGRLHPPPRAVPVLRLDGQPSPPGPDLACRWSGPTPPRPASSTPPTTSTT